MTNPATNYLTLDEEMIARAPILVPGTAGVIADLEVNGPSLKVLLQTGPQLETRLLSSSRTMRHGLMPNQLKEPEMVEQDSLVSMTFSWTQ